jgi:hypothetical protein
MTRRRALVHLSVTALVAGLLMAPAAAAASPAAAAAPSPGAATAASTDATTAAGSDATGSTAIDSTGAQLTAPSTHTLITGDRVAIGTAPDGRPTVTWLSGPTGAKAFQLIAGGGHLYVLPMSAAPLLGGILSLDLFDVAAVPQAAGTTLAVSYRGTGRQLPAGLTASGPGTVTVSDPAAFGRALTSQWQASTQNKQVRLGDVATLAPAGATAKKQPPAGALHTLRIRAVDRNGEPANAQFVAVNVESADHYIAGQQLFDGAAAFSVPTGHYSISGMVPTAEADGSVSWTMVSAPEVTVTRTTSVTLDARPAVPVTLTTPTPTEPLVSTLTYQRGDTVGSGFTESFTTFGPTSLYVVPVGSVSVGDLYFAATWNNASADGSTSYDVIKSQAGSIGRDWDYRPGPADLATVHADYVSPIPGRAELTSRIGLVPGVGVLSSVGYQIAAPTSRTEYVTAAPDLEWVPSLAADAIGDSGWTAGPARIFRGGEDISVRWLGQPMASGVQQQDGVQPLPCPFCIQDGQLLTAFAPLVDADGHWMYRASEASEQLTVSRDGTPVGTSRSGSGGFDVTTPGRYTVSYQVALDAPWWTTSTAVSTDWSFDSTATEPLPAGWMCGGGKGGGGGGKGGDGKAVVPAGPAPGGDGTCTLPALLLPSYQTPAGTDAVQPAGQPATVDVRVARPAGAVQQDVATFSAAVSFDDGASWTELDPTRTGPDSFRLQYQQPELADTNGFATLRIAATDATGASVQQTVTRAYPLAVTDVAPPPDGPPTRSDLADVCSTPVAPPFASCFARITPAAAAASADEPTGLSPADIRSAYGLGSSGGDDVTVAVVVAYDNPSAEADLAVYREHWGLPPCTSADGCFTKVNQRGDPGPLPVLSSGWAVETALDLDAISATCPGCRLLLVEADSASTVDLLNAALTASRLGADVISNSYGSTGEFSGEQLYEPYYRSIRVPFVVATGDYGYGNGLPLVGGVSYPAASASAIAVGGTTLTRSDTARGWTESAWALGTSGCSAYIGKPSWQKDTLCTMRTVADISAVGDPATGLAVYETTVVGGWVTVGGTSLSAPLVSGMIAVAGPTRAPGNGPTRFAAGLYAHPGLFNDVTVGSNGTNCSATYLCTALPGFDGPTGLGTPDGVAAFRSGRG